MTNTTEADPDKKPRTLEIIPVNFYCVVLRKMQVYLPNILAMLVMNFSYKNVHF